MGQEIDDSHFRRETFQRFQEGLHEETKLVSNWIADRQFSDGELTVGLELELCLVGSMGEPLACNQAVIQAVDQANVVPELSQFNIEFNVDPARLADDGIQLLSKRLDAMWSNCRSIASSQDVSIVSIGILPTLRDEHLVLKNMSSLHRYRALNEQVLRLRRGRPMRLDISGVENLVSEHLDVMLEAGTTSLQLHLQVPQSRAADAYNLATILSAPMVAISANSPLLFDKQLWQETRIPLFEQAVAMDGPINRVTFGTGYASRDLTFIFKENENLFPVLLPLEFHQEPEKLAHVRLQNGTIWRWNRPIIGFNADGCPHLRIEHRVMAAGTTLIDMTSQMALYYGLMVELLSKEDLSIAERLPFISAWTNFYDCARSGMKAHVLWLDGKKWPIGRLILQELIPAARRGLMTLKTDTKLMEQWLEVISKRAETGRTGAHWQSEFFARNRHDPVILVREYRDRQESGEPVHQWRY